MRLAERHGHGEKLIAWFETSGNAERYAPAYNAFVAFVRGERFLLDVNPEVRTSAQQLFDKLAAPRRHAQSQSPKAMSEGRKKKRKT